MATFYLINTTTVGTSKFFAGDFLDDSLDATTAIAAAGGVLWPSADAIVAAAAAKALAARRRGANESALDAIMSAAAHTAPATDTAAGQMPAAQYAARIQKKTVQITHADLTEAVNGTAQSIAIGTALPAGAMVLGTKVTVATLFSGGAASAVALDVGFGSAGNLETLIKDMDVFTGAATGVRQGSLGTAPTGAYSAQELLATFTPDGGHSLLNLTAGDATIDVYYFVGA